MLDFPPWHLQSWHFTLHYEWSAMVSRGMEHFLSAGQKCQLLITVNKRKMLVQLFYTNATPAIFISLHWKTLLEKQSTELKWSRRWWEKAICLGCSFFLVVFFEMFCARAALSQSAWSKRGAEHLSFWTRPHTRCTFFSASSRHQFLLSRSGRVSAKLK